MIDSRLLSVSGALVVSVDCRDGAIRSMTPAWRDLLDTSVAELLGRPWAELLHPEDHELAASGLSRVSLDPASALTFLLRMRASERGKWRWLRSTLLAGPASGSVLGLCHDETEKRERLELLERTLQDAQLAGWALDGASATVTVSRSACELLGRAASHLTLEGLLERFAEPGRGWLREALLRAMTHHESFELAARLDGAPESIRITGTPEHDGEELVWIHGTLARLITTADGRPSSEEPVRALHLWERTCLARDEERRRIARELHDHAGSALTSLLVMCRSLETAPDSDEREGRYARLAQHVTQVIDGIVRLSRGLNPLPLAQLGLGPALSRLAESTSSLHGLKVNASVEVPERALPAPVELAIYRVAQEALTNVVRHAGARNVWLDLAADGPDGLRVRVKDDGRGFQAPEPGTLLSSHRLGLMGIRERVAMLGGTTSLHTEPGSGTTLEVRVPARRHDETRRAS